MSLEDKLYAVQELKAEWGISSINAWRILKANEEYQQLAARVTQNLRDKGIPTHVNTRLAAVLTKYLYRDIIITLAAVGHFATEEHPRSSKEFADADVKAITSKYGNAMVLPYPTSSQQFFRRRFEDDPPYWLRLDYDNVITDVLVRAHAIGTLMEGYALVLRDMLTQERADLSDERRTYTLSAFLPAKMFDNARKVLTKAAKEHADKSDAELSEILHEFYWSAVDLAQCKDFMDGADNDYVSEINAQSPTMEEEEFLWGDGKTAYRRAIHEKTLWQHETQRRIAAGFIFGTYSDLAIPAAEKVSRALADLHEQLTARKIRLALLTQVNSPDLVILTEKRMVGQTQYFLRAITSQRNWLEKYLVS